MRKRVTDRQKREARRARTDAVLEGITAIESVYRDALADGAPPLNLDRERLDRGPGRRGPGARRLPRGRGPPSSSIPARACCSSACCSTFRPVPGARLAKLPPPRRDSSVGRAAHS